MGALCWATQSMTRATGRQVRFHTAEGHAPGAQGTDQIHTGCRFLIQNRAAVTAMPACTAGRNHRDRTEQVDSLWTPPTF